MSPAAPRPSARAVENESGAGALAPPRARQARNKREKIIDAATVLMNRSGLKGMTLQAVAQSIDLKLSAVTYYFRLKEQLASAVFESTIERLEAIAVEAGTEPTPRARLNRFLEIYFTLTTSIRRGQARPLATLADVRTLDRGVQAPLASRWNAVFRRIRDFFGPAGNSADRPLRTARAHMLIETLFWLPVWIGRYSDQDFDRLRARLLDVLEHGLAIVDASWDPRILAVDDLSAGDPARAQFLNAATRLISERGYGGASVERIVAELKVTKGSFYHHLDAKDDLVQACFERSFQRVSQAQQAADEAGGDQWRRLNATIATLLNFQLGGEWPLLRSTALLGLPQDIRAEMVEHANRVALRFAGALSDGIAEGSIRAIDPMIASQVIIATLNSAWELRNWAAGMDRDAAIALYASTLSRGLIDR